MFDSKKMNLPESDVVNFFVVRDELRLDLPGDADPPHRLACLQGPNCACGVYRRGPQQVGVHFVPVEGGEWGAKVGVFVVVQKTFQAGLGLSGTPHP